MLFRRFYDENLAQASYLIACESTREAVIVDPTIDIAFYTRAAGADRVRIAHVTETHVHADFVSGARALADATGATLHLSGEGKSEWAYSQEALANANVLAHGATFGVGNVRLEAIHTPGHTPEHLSFLVADLARGEVPVGIVTGDFVFVGDVGRPDLLERAVGATGSMEGSARTLYSSIQKIREYPDHLQLWPGHGAGSACGKALGSMPQSTLGYEKLFNWAFSSLTEREFVDRILTDQPVPPRYFAVMKRINRDAAGLTMTGEPKYLELEDIELAMKGDGVVVDSRPAQKFAAGHIPGTINIPLGKSFLNWAGALVPTDGDLYVIVDADSDDAARSVLRNLSKVGLARVRGVFRGEILHEWKSRHGQLQKLQEVDAPGLESIADDPDVEIIDVRNPDEWSHGHLPGATHVPLAALPERIASLDSSARIVLHCKGGGRSSIATSMLQARGFSNVSNLTGGYEGWVAAGLPTEVGPGDAQRSSGATRSSRKAESARVSAGKSTKARVRTRK
jgi:hydroxyacylglutathione hydrolase